MRAWRVLRRSLAWKVFFTYLIVITVFGIVLLSAAEIEMPRAFQRHLAAMAAEMGEAETLGADLFRNYRQALIDAVATAVVSATILAVGLGYYTSRRVVAPIQEMLLATGRIANGHYQERIALQGRETSEGAVDELGELALSFNRMAATLEHTESMRRELIGNVAHELRTPLTSIKGYMEGLMDGVLEADEVAFEKVFREADRLERLVSDLQELSRLEERAFRLTLRPLSVAAFVSITVDRLRPQFEGKNVSLGVDLPQGLPQILGDEDRLGQVLLNLLGNALQYTPPGKWARVSATRERDVVRISVTDEGIGIGREHLPHLFDRFYRADNSRSRPGGGSGIGLTIARHLVEAHGGEITASSQGLGRGSSFTFTVPMI